MSAIQREIDWRAKSIYPSDREQGRAIADEYTALRALNAEYEKALSVALKYLSGGNGMASEDVSAIVNAALLQRTTSEGSKP